MSHIKEEATLRYTDKTFFIAGKEVGIEEQSGEHLNMQKMSNLMASPKRTFGILRHPDTPGTGQSVRFGRRLYDDGDESRMSDVDSIASLPQIKARDAESESKDYTAKYSERNDASIVSDVSLSLLNLPTMEGYSDLHDTSLLQDEDDIKSQLIHSVDYVTPGRSFDSDYQSEYKTAASPSSTRNDASAHSDWATPKSRMSSLEDDENDPETFAVKSGPEASFSDLSIPWPQNASLPSPAKQNIQFDVSQMQDMSSVYFPGSLGRSLLSQKSSQKANEKDSSMVAASLISPETTKSMSPIENASPFGEILDVSSNMDRVHTERTTMLLSRLNSAQEMYTQLQKELESERIISQNARDELALERKRAKEKSEEHSQEMEHVRSLVAHLNEQSLRRKKGDSEANVDLPGSNAVNDSMELKGESKETTHEKNEGDGEQEDLHANEVEANVSGSSARAEQSTFDVASTKKEEDDRKGALQSQLDEMERLMQKSQEEKAQFEARIQDLDEMHYSVKLQLEEAEKDRDSMREQLDSLNQQMTSIIQEKEILIEEAEKRENAQKDISELKEVSQSQIDAPKVEETSRVHDENTVKDTSQELSTIRSRLQEVIEAEQESKLEAARLQEYAGRLESALEKQKEEILEMRQSFTDLQQENENLVASLAESDLARERSAEEQDLDKRYVAKRDHDELLDLAEQMQARIDMIQKERTDERKRVTSLEKELSNRGITIANLEKLHERLEEDNLNLGIALSSKQQELSLLKRLGTKTPISQTPRQTPGSTIRNRLAVRDLIMQSRTPVTLRKQNAEGENTAKALPLQDLTTNQTLKSVDDTQDHTLPPLQKGPSHLRATRRKTIDGRALLEDRTLDDRTEQPNGKNERSISTSPATKAMPPPPTARKSQSHSRSSTSNMLESSRTSNSSRMGSITNRPMRSSSAFGGGPRSSIAGSRYSTSSMSSSISAIRGPMDLSELTSSHN